MARFERNDEGEALTVTTQSGKTFPADLVILFLGVRPDTELAQHAGLEIPAPAATGHRRARRLGWHAVARDRVDAVIR